MAKQIWKPGNMIYPLPAVLVSAADKSGWDNILTVAWTGTVCTNPPMVYISVRPERYSYQMIRESGEFVINLTTEKLAWATDFCGVKSGKDVDKWEKCRLTRGKPARISAPVIEECPVNIECKVKDIIKLGSHDMFIAEVLCSHIDEDLFDEKDKIHLEKANLISYSHGEYFSLSKEAIGKFGYSVMKKKKRVKGGKK